MPVNRFPRIEITATKMGNLDWYHRRESGRSNESSAGGREKTRAAREGLIGLVWLGVTSGVSGDPPSSRSSCFSTLHRPLLCRWRGSFMQESAAEKLGEAVG